MTIRINNRSHRVYLRFGSHVSVGMNAGTRRGEVFMTVRYLCVFVSGAGCTQAACKDSRSCDPSNCRQGRDKTEIINNQIILIHIKRRFDSF